MAAMVYGRTADQVELRLTDQEMRGFEWTLRKSRELFVALRKHRKHLPRSSLSNQEMMLLQALIKLQEGATVLLGR